MQVMRNNWTLDVNAERDYWMEQKEQLEAMMQEDDEDALDTEEESTDDCDSDDEFEEDAIWPEYSSFYPWNYVMLGDELEVRDQFGGIVIGIIRDLDGRDVCYKLWVGSGEFSDTEDRITYVQASDVTLHESYGDSEESLKRIGYHLVEEESGFSYFTNPDTGDVIVC